MVCVPTLTGGDERVNVRVNVEEEFPGVPRPFCLKFVSRRIHRVRTPDMTHGVDAPREMPGEHDGEHTEKRALPSGEFIQRQIVKEHKRQIIILLPPDQGIFEKFAETCRFLVLRGWRDFKNQPTHVCPEESAQTTAEFAGSVRIAGSIGVDVVYVMITHPFTNGALRLDHLRKDEDCLNNLVAFECRMREVPMISHRYRLRYDAPGKNETHPCAQGITLNKYQSERVRCNYVER